MSWKIALTVALVTGLVTAAVAAPVADKVTGMHGVSSFEGKRGYLVVFVLIPAAVLGGTLLGLLGTRLVHATDWVHFWKAAGLSVLLGQVALFGIAGLSLLSIPRAPRLHGQTLAIEIEVHIPLARLTPRSTEPDQIRMSLYAGPRDNHYAEIDRSRFREADGHLVVTGLAPLNSSSPTRMLSFHIEEHAWLAFDFTALPASPGDRDLEWSGFEPLRDARYQDGRAVPSDVRLRYRVLRQ